MPLHTLLAFPVSQGGLPGRGSSVLLPSVSCERAKTTGQRAWRTTESETRPFNALPITLLPQVPTTIRSTSNSSARSTTSSATSPILRCAPATVPPAILTFLSRVRALSRRPPEKEAEETVLTVGDVALVPVRHEVRRAGERVDLTAKEFALLATLMQRPGQVFTRSVLLDTVWGGTTGAYTNVVDLYIHYLRKKLDAGEELSRIRTVHGTGYTFDPRPEYLGQASSPGPELQET
jgi:DNA-binding winged helix-turn-helix (wHTH) protein